MIIVLLFSYSRLVILQKALQAWFNTDIVLRLLVLLTVLRTSYFEPCRYFLYVYVSMNLHYCIAFIAMGAIDVWGRAILHWEDSLQHCRTLELLVIYSKCQEECPRSTGHHTCSPRFPSASMGNGLPGFITNHRWWSFEKGRDLTSQDPKESTYLTGLVSLPPAQPSSSSCFFGLGSLYQETCLAQICTISVGRHSQYLRGSAMSRGQETLFRIWVLLPSCFVYFHM